MRGQSRRIFAIVLFGLYSFACGTANDTPVAGNAGAGSSVGNSASGGAESVRSAGGMNTGGAPSLGGSAMDTGGTNDSGGNSATLSTTKSGTEQITGVPMSDCPDPEWLCEVVRDMRLQMPNERIYRDMYHGEFVFFVPAPPTPDSWSTLYDRCGQVLCHPTGGISGGGDQTCLEYTSQPIDTMVGISLYMFQDC
jgi:hypothetical protein